MKHSLFVLLMVSCGTAWAGEFAEKSEWLSRAKVDLKKCKCLPEMVAQWENDPKISSQKTFDIVLSEAVKMIPGFEKCNDEDLQGLKEIANLAMVALITDQKKLYLVPDWKTAYAFIQTEINRRKIDVLEKKISK